MVPSGSSVRTQPSGDRAPVVRSRVADSLRVLVRVGIGSVFSAALLVALVVGGLYAAPTLGVAAGGGVAAPPDSSPRRPPIIPPSVPIGAREDWAVWSYVDKINQAWGKDWPLVVQWFEELYARYPHNAMAQDKLYAAYVEDGRTLQAQGDLAGARRRYEQAAVFEPDRSEAWNFLAQLDAARR